MLCTKDAPYMVQNTDNSSLASGAGNKGKEKQLDWWYTFCS